MNSHKIVCFCVLLILCPQKLALFVEVLWVQDFNQPRKKISPTDKKAATG
jgi:hypothetical protein